MARDETPVAGAGLLGGEGHERVRARGDGLGAREDHKTIDHQSVGPVTVDCDDILTGGDPELKIVIMTAAPGREHETKLQLTAVTGAPSTMRDRSPTLRSAPRCCPRRGPERVVPTPVRRCTDVDGSGALTAHVRAE